MSDKSENSGKSPQKGGMKNFFKAREEEAENETPEKEAPAQEFLEDEQSYSPLKGYLYNLAPLPEIVLTNQQRKDAGCNSAALPPCSSPASVDNRNDESSSVEFDFVIESEDHTPAKKTRTKKHYKKRKSLVAPLRRDKKSNKLKGRKRLIDGSPEKLLHSQQKRRSNAKIRSSRPLTEREIEQEQKRDHMSHLRQTRRKHIFVRETPDSGRTVNLIGLNRETYDHIISNQPIVQLTDIADNALNDDSIICPEISRDNSSDDDTNISRNVTHANVSPFTRDTRRFRQHRIARQPITSTYPGRVDFGEMVDRCNHCNSLNFLNEGFNCCEKGKVNLPPPPALPEPLKNLFVPDNPNHREFMKHIRYYNNLFSFASTTTGKGKSDLAGRGGPQTVKICGNYRHRVSGPHPGDGYERRYGQFYFFSGQDAIYARQRLARLWDVNLSEEVLTIIQNILENENPYAGAYKHMYEVEIEENMRALQEGRDMPIIYMEFVDCPDRGRYNAPVVNEVAVIFSSNDGAPPARTFIIHTRDNSLQDINIVNKHLDGLCYPILFPSGGHGFEMGLQHVPEFSTAHRHTVTMREFLKFHLCERDYFNPILFSGLLFQQYLVDTFCRMEQNNLNFLRSNQDKLYSENYDSLIDYLERRRQNNEEMSDGPGRMVILPSSYQGSPRAMRQLYEDAMSAVAHFGKPSAFITMTCNPKWPEIERISQGRTSGDMPHVMSRVFKLYLKSLLNDLWEGGVCGKVIHKLHVIEFQKRGLPHAHILLKFSAADELVTKDDIDSFISAEIPDEQEYPLLHDTIKSCMLHGPCGERCFVDGKCSKGFPKPFAEETTIEENSYPIYRRRNIPEREIKKHGIPFDNRWVVPYNPFLSQKYNCHINVECCNSIRAIKYVHKYVYKGYDCASVRINETYGYDEISHYVNGRYVSAPESAWRIHGFKLHDQSHSVVRLSVHKEGQQPVYFREGGEEEAADQSRERNTHLLAWFALNRDDPNAHGLLYTEVPLWYHFDTKERKWKKRKRKVSPFTLVRMHSASPKDVERFYLRLLLFHVRGATSFEDLRTVSVNGIRTVFTSFRDACVARGLVQDDEYLRQTLADAIQSRMPSQLRCMFAYILVYCGVDDGNSLWEEFREHLAEDFLRRGRVAGMPDDESYDHALRHIQSIVESNGKIMEDYRLPSPGPLLNPTEGIDDGIHTSSIDDLNSDQRRIADAVINSVEEYLADGREMPRIFFVDGPGGTGKSFLFNFLASHFRSLGINVSMSAWSGVAATLLLRAKTVHSTFKIPLDANSESTSLLNRNSDTANFIRDCPLFFIDEVSMMDVDSLHVIDTLLRDLTGRDDVPFGGKVLVFGGDFRQTLPIVVRGSEADIVERCVKSSPLWSIAKKFKLVQNMRAANDSEFAEFILSIGNDTCVRKPDDPFKGCIQLPLDCIVTNVVDSLFPEGFDPVEARDRVILTPRNDTSLRINDFILERQEGEEFLSCSADSVECEDPADDELYSVEYLNSLNFSGLPPHKLKLKIGCTVMLLRNLNTEGGLCNGSRLVVREIYDRFLVCETIIGGQLVMIPKIQLYTAKNYLPFKFKRFQFPLRLAYSITINKAQGQTIKYAGVLLEKPVFGHGQLYVALSRAQSFQNLKVQVDKVPGKQGLFSGKMYTANVVYTQIIREVPNQVNGR